MHPRHSGIPTFEVGWWESQNTSATTGDESTALAEQLAFTYVGDSLLIPDTETRTRLLALHWNVVSIGRELRTPQSVGRLLQFTHSWTLVLEINE